MERDFKNLVLEYKKSNIAVRIRRDSRAHHIILRPWQRQGHKMDGVIATVPMSTKNCEVLQFVEKKADWILEHLSSLPKLVKLADGVTVPYLGICHKIIHEPSARRGVWRGDLLIHVSGKSEFLPRRLISWFKSEAKRLITERVVKKTIIIKKKFRRITIRDTRSRWGSCSANGNLSFSWRVIMAPDFVFDYVIAHEVAHLVEANHGVDFWNLTRNLCADVGKAKNWLRKNGQNLHRYY